MKFAVQLLLVLATGTAAQAQIGVKEPPPPAKATGPSLADTTAWISQKFAASGIQSPNAGNINTQVSFDGCTMTVMRQTDLKSDASNTESIGREILQVDLQMIASFFAVPSYIVNARSEPIIHVSWSTVGSRAVIKALWKERTRGDRDFVLPPWGTDVQQLASTKDLRPKGQFLLPDMETAERIQNALNHAIALCRKKAADEKAAEPAKPKELF